MRYLICLFFTVSCFSATAQYATTYTDKEGDTHLLGPLTIADLQRGDYAEWYVENAAATPSLSEIPAWADRLGDTRVKVFLGTWCGDSQEWVPQFLTLWESLGLDENQLELIALEGSGDNYKQGPAGEEAGYRIHRVPTFVFLEGEQETARIVERPRTGLLSDLAQIATGYPAEPRYQVANHLLELFDTNSMDSLHANIQEIWQDIYRDIGNPGELRTLGRVLHAAGRSSQAQLTYRINWARYKNNPSTIESYASILLENGEPDQALALYERLLIITPDNEEVSTIVADLKAKKEPASN